MRAAKHRAGVCIVLAFLFLTFFAFSAPYVAGLLVFFVGTLALLAILLHRDARQIALELHADRAGRTGQELTFTLKKRQTGHLWVSGMASVELEIVHTMFDQKEQRQFQIPLREEEDSYSLAFAVNLCGEVEIRCVKVSLWDVLGLFRVEGAKFPTTRTIIYPPSLQLDLTLSQTAAGTANREGLMQNRRGNDLSEVYDLREYVPGDDIRAIHWKLSSKTDTLILRQPSNPSHYDAVLLPDLGLYQEEQPVSFAEENGAVSLTIALGEKLLEQGVSFCMAIPSQAGVELYEIQGRQQFYEQISQWMSIPIPRQSGAGLQFFLSEHLESHFTRMLLVSGGSYTQDIGKLETRIGVTAISTDDHTTEPVHLEAGLFCESVVVPTKQKKNTAYRIVC